MERKIEIEIERDDATAYDPVDRQWLVCLGAVLSCDEVRCGTWRDSMLETKQDRASGDTTPCGMAEVTPVILHGVVSPNLHGVVSPECCSKLSSVCLRWEF